VHLSKDIQIERFMSRNFLTQAEAVARIEAQMLAEKKKELANFLIDTSGTMQQSIDQTNIIIQKLKLVYINEFIY
jgi:dephospho-CoA kinase